MLQHGPKMMKLEMISYLLLIAKSVRDPSDLGRAVDSVQTYTD